MVGGSTAKQIDCGSGTYSHGSSISFNFTFNNVPKVFLTGNTNGWAPSIAVMLYSSSITTTGFILQGMAIVSGATSAMGGSPINWLAIG